MQACFAPASRDAIPLILVNADDYATWLKTQDSAIQKWLTQNDFQAKANTFCCIPDANSQIHSVIVGVAVKADLWDCADLATRLPKHQYRFELDDSPRLTQLAIAWGAGAYQFNRYRDQPQSLAKLSLPESVDQHFIEAVVSAIYLARDLINTPTEDMGPAELAEHAQNLAKTFQAEIKITEGEQLLANNFPAIHAVGRASSQSPRLIDLHWGDPNKPLLTLVGKGVCFDTGGLDLKPSGAMRLMKKDMGGAAHVLALAQLIMATQLPVHLRVLIPAVENSVAANAYRPGDVIPTRAGKTIEIGNTDAEGRVILADALTAAMEEKPDLILDFATLTGAARVALGTDIPVMFCNQDQLAEDLKTASSISGEMLWQLPLYQPYRQLIDSKIANINNSGSSPYAGAITAALFLQEFVSEEMPWAHFDLMAWNVTSRPGRPEGGDAMGLRAVFTFLQERYS